MALDAEADSARRAQNRYRREAPGHTSLVRLPGERRRTATKTRVEDGSWSAPMEEVWLVAGGLDDPSVQKVSTVRRMPQITQLSSPAERIWLASFPQFADDSAPR